MKNQWIVRVLSKTLTLASHTRSLCSSTTTSSPSTTFSLKNVTKSNFESALTDLRCLVRDADFVSIDLEMTGVTSAPWRESLECDRFDIRYLKTKDSAEKFAVVQFGVCPFRWDRSKQSFVAHPHNFYIFPRQEIPVDWPSYEFLCQTTSLDFLAKYQFDFNLCIQEGISYLSRGQEDEALRRLHIVYEDELSEMQCNLREARDTPLVRVADVLFTERMKNRISEWRDGLLLHRKGGSKFQESSSDSSQQFQTIFFKMRPALLLNGFTSRQLRLIQLVTEKHFEDLVYIYTNVETSSVQIVYTDSKNDREGLVKEVKDGRRKEAEMKIKAAVGFRHVFDLLSSEQKLIVGHNCFLDIAHIYSKFVGPLPLTAEEFSTSIHKYFPYIIDTKILLNANDVLRPMMKKGSTSLAKAFACVCPEIASGVNGSGLGLKPRVQVEVQVDDMRSSNWNSGAKHEAGYDAFMTGCVFAQACSHLGFDFKLHSSFTNLANDEKLRKHINLLYLSWFSGEIIDLRTGKQTAESSYYNSLKTKYPKIVFSNIALIWGFPLKLKAREIRECISKTFGPLSVTLVYNLDETAVFVQFSKAELVSDFLRLKEILERSNGPISVLHPLSKLLEGGNTRAATYEVYKEICSSPISEVLFADQAEMIGIKWKTEPVGSNVEAETRVGETFIQGDEMNANESDLGKISSMINDLSRGHFRESEIIDSSYPAEAQVSK
ncbi:Poly(A)-specific ribonuclease [Actinidia chinensis var. chinensis]|uniref:Poly(A)-specific ribonuclease n=1 Tax=Actinidia chinensis var. chinensis TaxID=1590841 RepID=A0A2R6QD17_ACTCC|nr:Poly(A)-specific ribonuclease [Actinidia chinensis var. chinensis]